MDKELIDAIDAFLKKVTDMRSVNPISFKPPHNLLLMMKRDMAENKLSMTRIIVDALRKRYS